MAKKRRIHVTMPAPVSDALKVLADLEGRDVSDIITDIARVDLDRRGLLPVVTPEQFTAELEKRRADAKVGRGPKTRPK